MIELKDQKEQDNKDSLEEAETIVKMKNSGYERNSPQYQATFTKQTWNRNCKEEHRIRT